MKVQLRRGELHQLAEILPLVGAYHGFEHIHSSACARESAVRQLLKNPHLGQLWLIDVGTELAGYIALCRGFSIEFNGFDAFVDEFFLLPEFRGRGFGKLVLTSIADEARKLDINAQHLEVARDNHPARKLYAGAGFKAREKYLLMSLMLNNITDPENNEGGNI